MGNYLRTELMLAALDMAIMMRRPRSVIHHSDHGCQYTSYAFGKRCVEASIVPSMGTVGDAYDNAMAESFFATWSGKCSTATGSKPRPKPRARSSVGWKVGTIPTDVHSSLGYRSPANYESHALSHHAP